MGGLPIGATTMNGRREFVLKDEKLNLMPQPCYRCKAENDGDHVYVLEATAVEAGQKARTLFWCRPCIVNVFGDFAETPLEGEF